MLVDRWGGRPDGGFYERVLSANGRWLAFYSTAAADLLRTDPGKVVDVYVWRMP